jgi:tetratricopeptide (TPR) repeat protein/transglutaminase-like putative cysteine protease
MVSALERAKAAGPDSALFHEVAAWFAIFQGHESDEVDHFVRALLDAENPTPVLHLHALMTTDFSFDQRRRVRDLLRELVAAHPKPEVRSLAAFHLTWMLNAEGRLGERDEVLRGQPGRFPLAVVGTWDNDQGKGFDFALAPESRPGLGETYDGRFGKLAWRTDVPFDPRGRLDLSSLLTPNRFAVAFAQGTVDIAEGGFYQLRLYTTGATKVWVDGQLLFGASQIDRSVWDNVVVPLKLAPGSHTVLIKSAHKEGAWSLAARMVPAASMPLAVSDAEQMVDFHVRGLPPLSARTMAHRAQWAHHAVGGAVAVRAADAFAQAFPSSIAARSFQIEALWFNQERGRTADALSGLDASVGGQLPFVRLRQLRFWHQQGFRQKARGPLIELTTVRPELSEAWELLVESYRSEGWTEDELRAQQERLNRFGPSAERLLDWSKTLLRFGRRREALAALSTVQAELPLQAEVLRRLAELHVDAGEFFTAETVLSRRLESWPTDFPTWMQLAEIRRRVKDFDGARAALDAAARLAPDAANPWVKRGELAYEGGAREEAVALWRKALERNPENESLANRVDFLAPAARGPWMADAPDESEIERIVSRRKDVKQVAGADVAWLLDHEVTLLNTDGSTSNVVTAVVHAFNAQGRDRIIKQTVGHGRLRVLHSYSVDEKGVRTEASSERSRQIFFRGLQPGATVVLQYRLDVPPSGYLSRYLTKSWSFQSVSEQRQDARFVLWAPLGTVLNEHRVGMLERKEERRGDQLRVEWALRDAPPIVSEPYMPAVVELAASVRLSTIPDWKTYLSWEKSLLDGVFRDSPELDALATRLGDGANGAGERLERIHQYVMEEIRYQQDYESFIAGVKPHAAPMVLERRYGDCKDKAVLFITLAKKLGVEAHFANVRTRDVGPVSRDVPMQQFNHAIVYVPAQPGVPEARFFDPTADMLDLDVIRHDDVGTSSLVIDPNTGQYAFRDIPLQEATKDRVVSQLDLSLGVDGSASGIMTVEAKGRAGSWWRVAARDSEVFRQAVQRSASSLVANATTSEVSAIDAKNLRAAAKLTARLETKTFARPEGDTLRIKLPNAWNPRPYFALSTRRHPLLFGAPFVDETAVSLTLPEGFEAKKLPASGRVERNCLTLERKVSSTPRSVTSRVSFTVTCERIPPGDYPSYRAGVDEMLRLLDDELVLGATGRPSIKRTRTSMAR